MDRLALVRAAEVEGNAQAARALGPHYELIAACVRGDTPEAARLLAQGVMPLPDPDWAYSWSPLHYAAHHGHGEVVRLLLDHGANVNRREKDDFTALTLAAAVGHWEVVRLMSSRGGDVRHIDATGKSALSLARRNGPPELAAHLESPRAAGL